MTNKTSTISKIFLTIAVVCSLAFGSLRVYMMQTAYDAYNGFFTNETLHALFGYGLAALAVLVAVSAYIYIKEENCSALPERNAFVKAASLIAGCALCGFVIYGFAKAVLPGFDGIETVDMAMMVLCAIGMLYFFTMDKKGDFRALLCAASALALLAMVLGLYFDRTVSYANHSVILCFAAAIFTMLAFTAEANFALGRPAYKRYLAYAPSAVVLSLSLSVPDIIFFVTHRAAVLTDIYYDILLFAFALYHLSRIVSIAAKKN